MGQRRNIEGDEKSRELSEYENPTYQNTGDAAKAVLKQEIYTLEKKKDLKTGCKNTYIRNIYIRKEERSQDWVQKNLNKILANQI